MPKSKRNQVVNLTKVSKRQTREKKDRAIEEIRKCLEKFRYAYVLKLENQRNKLLKGLRNDLKPGRLFCGRNKVMQVALGVDPESECQEGIHALSERISGEVGLLLTDMTADQLMDILANHEQSNFARSGCISTGDITLEAGDDALSRFPHSQEPFLRKLGLPTLLVNGKIRLMGDYEVCKTGKALTPEQCQLVKLLGIPMAVFRVSIAAQWSKENSKCTTT
ncbi:mRNA turnover protein 4 mrt4, putative [Perkinsus marinus ATCC 50983]|uniref:Ribosome assembly factor mrt4 n=1 Tax=Perkinsus marinus (strain ATCC 50983 / TXsc) TaxID=423536 RepID=C5LPK4_PERM5|nr:mRNA turnover protein 4 mrt4, putative [Perkinsus marinus ATCC 50983]EER01324.1 mRNA turnover protein 4 mrt4, putative [Perkinsus marinus ATCC 50983]|eukprot:XP_002768606.1 mRNA turnover protein 4 mrt4, putative [Perkinsus marinus ATCC 50983]